MYVLLGASLWGIIGLFIQALYGAGFSAFQIVTLRVVSAALMLTLYLLIWKPSLLKVEWKDLLSFVGTGIFSIVFFNWAYFTAIEAVSLSVAVILLYTGPAFVVVLSRLVFGEPLTLRKAAALGLTLAGCVLVAGVIPLHTHHLSWYGLLVGLGAGFGYALYSIFGKYALRKYDPLTVITYTFLFASAFMLPVSGWSLHPGQWSAGYVWPLILGLGFFPTALAYGLYTKGLSMVESGRASVTATIEPVVATLLGVWVFRESLSVYQLTGMALVLAAVVLIQFRKRPMPR